MRRHVIVGRLGVADETRIPVADDEVVTNLDFVAGRKRLSFGLGQALDDLYDIAVYPSEVGLDLGILAALVHAADTRVARSTESQDAWTRELRIVVPVSDPARWFAAAPVVEQMLGFLSGDKWTIGFRARPNGFESLVRTRPRGREARFDSLSLFSGGLDSLIGAIDLIEAGAAPLFVSHVGESATSDAQYSCFRGLTTFYEERTLDRFRVWMSFPQGLVRNVQAEPSTRARSFLFFALGVLAGSGLQRPFLLRAPENGLIALNVPLDILRLGSNSTRTTHPFYIGSWNRLIQVLGLDGSIENPYWNRTKGEMTADCANQDVLRQLAPIALSCASPAKARWQKRRVEHCGYCLPCLIRRAALSRALGTDPTSYTLQHLGARPLNSSQAEGVQVRSFQLAIDRIRARPGDAKLLIHKQGPLLASPGELDELAAVYQRGLNEVGDLLTGVTTRSL